MNDATSVVVIKGDATRLSVLDDDTIVSTTADATTIVTAGSTGPRGPKGDQGSPGYHVGPTPPEDQSLIWIDTSG